MSPPKRRAHPTRSGVEVGGRGGEGGKRKRRERKKERKQRNVLSFVVLRLKERLEDFSSSFFFLPCFEVKKTIAYHSTT
jgi:hypothetical protein